jgi:hypothetical protein
VASAELWRTTASALTGLNYNGKLEDSEPVTVGFSDAVGEILVSNPTVAARKLDFKF